MIKMCLGAALAAGLSVTTAGAETLVGSNVNARVLVGFDVNDAALAEKAPEGWKPIAFPGGPFAGTDLLVIFLDRHLQKDAEGKPQSPSKMRLVALTGLAVKPETKPRLFIYRVYATEAGYDPYGNGEQAEISRSSGESGAAEGPRERQEQWAIAPASGGEMTLSLSFASGNLSWGPGEAMPFSAANPDFHRIYRYDQLVEVVSSEGLGKPLSGEFVFENSVPEWAAVFDGSEAVRAILDNPILVRDVFLP